MYWQKVASYTIGSSNNNKNQLGWRLHITHICVCVGGKGGGIISVNQEFYSYYVIYAATTYPVILHFLLSSRRILHNLLFQWLNLQRNLRLVYSYGVSCKKFYLLKISYSAYISNTSGQLEDRGILEPWGWWW